MNEDLTKQMPSDDLRSILARLDTIEDKVDRRLQETRPIWERVLNELTELRTEINGVHSDVNGVRNDVNGVRNDVDGVRNEVNEVRNEVNGVRNEVNGVRDEVNGVRDEVNGVRDEVNEVRGEINGLRIEMREGFEKSRIELGKGMRFMTKRIDVLNHDILNVRADVRELDQRVTKLEGEPAP